MAPKPAKDAPPPLWQSAYDKISDLLTNKYMVAISVMMYAVYYTGDLKTLNQKYIDPMKYPDLRPFKAAKMTELQEFQGDYKNQMLWGSYRSGLYFGMRTRSPLSLLTGLIWFDPDSPETLMSQRVRHAANQEDKLTTYGWVRHDGRTYGRQVLVDDDYGLTITMVKDVSETSGVGGDWAVRVNVSKAAGGNSRAAAARRSPVQRLSLVMYVTDEDKPTEPWWVMPDGETSELKEPVLLAQGGNKVVGPWSMHVVDSSGKPKRKAGAARLNYLALPAREGEHDFRLHVRELLMSIMYEQLERNPTTDNFHLNLPNGATTGSDMAMFQVTVGMNSCVDFVYLSHKTGGERDPDEEEARVRRLSGASLSALAQEAEAAFDARFDQVFPLKPVVVEEGQPGVDAVAASETAKAALSNTLGSMGYFYGSSQVRVAAGVVRESPPGALFTAVPSRSFFPRGFLWDEGFHQLLVHRWDPQLSRDVVAHWLDLMNKNGWIGREQILGKEALARVPAEFVVQDPRYANPPSLVLPITRMAAELAEEAGGVGDNEEARANRAFLQRAWPRLLAWVTWYNTTQAGPEPLSYRWHGRNATTPTELNPKTLTSGLDDYPRASHPTVDERHLDLRCWMALLTSSLTSIGRSLGITGPEMDALAATHTALDNVAELDALHWDETVSQYRDWGLHTEGVRLQRHTFNVNGQNQEMSVRVVTDPPKHQFVPHFGYVSLFPLMMRLLPAHSPRLGDMLRNLEDTRLLWSPHGLRSLAETSSIYRRYNTQHDPPYWRGQIWINLNYLTLAALKQYSELQGPYRSQALSLYTQLRANLMRTLVGQYSSRGYLFEQYDDRDGSGTSSHPFTGWTALVTLIASEQF